MKKSGSVIFTDPPVTLNGGHAQSRNIVLDHGLALAMVPKHYVGYLHSGVGCLLCAYADTAGITPYIEETLYRRSDGWLVSPALPHDLSQANALTTDSR